MPKPLYTLDPYTEGTYSKGAMLSSKSMPRADVSTPPFAAVAAIERASISATEAICPSAGLEPSLLSKLRVV